MTLRLITASERLAHESTKTTALVAGPSKIGKTTLATQFNPARTLFADFEAGTESIQDWLREAHHTDTIRTWQDAVDLICLIGGVDPASPAKDMFSNEHYERVRSENAAFPMDEIDLIFTDSVTELSKRCAAWAQQQPEAWAWNKQSNKWVPDTWGLYRLIGQKMPYVLKHLQYTPAKTVIYIAGLELYTDDAKREMWRFQMEGGKTATAIQYIVSNIISYDLFDYTKAAGGIWSHNPIKGQYRAFVCQRQNPFNLPAGNRAPRDRPLDVLEEPDLRKLIDKINPRQS